MRSLKQHVLWFTIVMALVLIFPALIHAQSDSGEGVEEETPYASSYDQSSYDWEFDTSLTYYNGEFESSSSTDTLYWANELTRFFERGDVSITLPLLWQDTGPGVTAIGGRPYRTNQNFFGGDAEGGIGDVLLQGRYYVFNETTQPFNLNALGRVKFPTADDDEGLGTGEFDETIGFETSKTLDDEWNLYGDVYFTHIGEPPGTDLDNEFAFDVGVGYDFSDATEATLYYAQRTALVDDRDDPREIILGVEHELNSNVELYGNVGIGLSDGSPDARATTGLAYLF